MGRITDQVVVATHNIMGGRLLSPLLDYYRSLKHNPGLGVLCLQENQSSGNGHHAEEVANALGPEYAIAHDLHELSVATIYNRDFFEVEHTELIALPALTQLSWVERLYMSAGERKHALVTTLRHEGGTMAVVNFHLEAGGGNTHRKGQMERIANWLETRGHTGSVTACGDSNSFALRGQLSALQFVLSPLRRFGARDEGKSPTHYFSRMREPRFVKKILVALGKLGIDYPRRLDVVCTNLPVLELGQMDTRESDHDLVWARVALGSRD